MLVMQINPKSWNGLKDKHRLIKSLPPLVLLPKEGGYQNIVGNKYQTQTLMSPNDNEATFPKSQSTKGLYLAT